MELCRVDLNDHEQCRTHIGHCLVQSRQIHAVAQFPVILNDDLICLTCTFQTRWEP